MRIIQAAMPYVIGYNRITLHFSRWLGTSCGQARSLSRDRERWTVNQTDRQRQSQRERQRDTKRDRDRRRDRERHREIRREREVERQTGGERETETRRDRGRG